MIRNRISFGLWAGMVIVALLVGAIALLNVSASSSKRAQQIIVGNLEQAVLINEIRSQALLSASAYMADMFSGDYLGQSLLNVLESGDFQVMSKINDLLASNSINGELVDGAVIVKADGEVVASSFPALVGQDLDYESYDFQKVNEGSYISASLTPDMLRSFPWDSPKLAFSSDIKNSDGMKVILFASNELLVSTILEGTQGAAERVFFDRNMQSFFPKGGSSFSRFIESDRGEAFLSRLKGEIDSSKGDEGGELKSYKSDPYIVFLKTVDTTGTSAVVLFDENVYKTKVLLSTWPLLLSMLLVCFVALFVAIAWPKKIFAPFETLVKPSLLASASGDANQEIDYKSSSEIGVIARVFNELRAELLHKERELREAEMRFALLAEQKEDIVFEWDAKSDTVLFAEVFYEKFGFHAAKYDASRIYINNEHTHPEDMDIANDFFKAAFSKTESAKAVFRIRRVDGAYLWVDARVSALYDGNDEFYGTIGVLSDIHELKTEEYRLAERVRIDGLSGVYSRQAFEAYARELINKCTDKGTCSERVVLVFLDIDDFKNFNSEYGHAYGDRVIRYFGSVLNGLVEGYGIAGRVGGDEFALALELNEGGPTLENLLDRLQSQLMQGMKSRKGEEPTIVSASYGTAACPRHGSSYEELMQYADFEMMGNKKRAREELKIEVLHRLENEGVEEAT